MPGILIAPQSGASAPSCLGSAHLPQTLSTLAAAFAEVSLNALTLLVSCLCTCCFLPLSLHHQPAWQPPAQSGAVQVLALWLNLAFFSPRHEFIVHTAKGTSSWTLHLARQPWIAQPCLSSQLSLQGPSVTSLCTVRTLSLVHSRPSIIHQIITVTYGYITVAV